VMVAMLLVVGLWLVATAVVAVRAGLDLRAGRRAGHAARHQSLIAVAEGRPLGQLREAQKRFQRAHSWLGSPILAPVRVDAVVGLLTGPRTYLVFAANNAEMRAGSGMFLSVGQFITRDGSVRLTGMGTVNDVAIPPGAVPLQGDLAGRWGWLKPQNDWRNL